MSRAALSPSKRQRHKMRKAANRIRERISCLVKDLHNKVMNGARNIMLRALQATAFIITGDAVLTLNAAV
ncbi:hypothetical protein [Coleofasciculus sp.]|uniref:hypothetical protein n=1 Tax=Coleofasciculus sp. TaxID=3100458 RepID=UPI0039F962D8